MSSSKMSGGIVQLVATGAQDTWLSGKPEISFFRSNYKRYTHYAAAVERQTIQGQPFPGSISTIRIEKKGDLLSYMYLTASDLNGSLMPNLQWSNVIDRVELLIGGQVIDLQDVNYSTDVEPCTGAQNWNQRYQNNNSGTDFSTKPSNKQSSFYPFKFFFCKDWSVSLPLVSLQYHDVEIRITWSTILASSTVKVNGNDTAYSTLNYQLWCNFVYLDQAEREYFAKSAQDLLITQVQRVPIGSAAVQELALAQPVKFLAFQCVQYGAKYSSDGTVANYGNQSGGASGAVNYQLKVQINGVDVGESRSLAHWSDVNQYYHTPWGYTANGIETPILIIPYCLDTSKLQPTGTLNFSRIDTYRLVVPSSLSGGLKALVNTSVSSPYLYAVNYNVLRIQKGMGSVLYAN
jgi:Major capsid protein N-terminus/Large eukaryotic DNA virus major capsid protein